MKWFCSLIASGLLLGALDFCLGANEPLNPQLTIAPDQQIVIVGNTLAERMQHDGWLETLLQNRFPQQRLRVRNLGFSADALTEQLRVTGFGSQDEWLKRTQADVIFAFFGFNESFAGEAGLEKFKADLKKFISDKRQHQYNGHAAPQIVLFSPIAHEDLGDPNLPDGRENNERIKRYTEAMAEVARQQKVVFVDLFGPTLAAFKASKTPLTINGIHLNEAGNRRVAEIIEQALFAARIPIQDEARLAALREAVTDKNFYWFHRYQTTDGYNVHGGRADLKFIAGQSNREVMNREMEILEAMAANRDPRIWALAQGHDLAVDDSGVPAHIEVKTNAPGEGPDGAHLYLGGEEAIDKMEVADGMQVNLFASEEEFPDLINPVQMSVDPKGRLFVGTWNSYPHWKPGDAMNDKLLILEDQDGDGKADRCKTFADKLHNPTGFEFWGGGVIVAMVPDILFLKDTDGDDVADQRIRILHGLSSGDTHHSANSFVVGPDGAVYFQEGIFHRTQIETPYGPIRNKNGCVWRFDPRSYQVQRYIPYDFLNPHGHEFDRWGQGFMHDGTNAYPYHDTIFSGHIDYPDRHSHDPPCPNLYEVRTRPCPGTLIISSNHFPEENQGNLLVANVIGFQGVLQYKLQDKESSFEGIPAEHIVRSSDRNFRPTDFEIGPQGAIYFSDWQNPVIGHMQHHIRDPSRDHKHGRVYRITYPSRPLSEPARIAGAPIASLLDFLKSRENYVRYRARIELSDRDSNQVIQAIDQWIAELDPSDLEYQHHLLEALWIHQQHHVVNEGLLEKLLMSPDYRARAAATRVVGYWQANLSNPLALLKERAIDEHPRVRLEAVRACSFLPTAKAMEVALSATKLPMDKYLEYTLAETIKQLQSQQN
jgi:lysophospholipase L1-like esterase/glucose/arabinose dehydrogenase